MDFSFFLALISLSAVVGFIVDAVGTVFASFRGRLIWNAVGTGLTGALLGLLAGGTFLHVLEGILAGGLAFLLILALVWSAHMQARRNNSDNGK